MKRKKFIQTTAVAGLGTMLMPKIVLSEINKTKNISIGFIGTVATSSRARMAELR